MTGFLLPDAPVASVDEYRTTGGGAALERVHTIGPDDVIASIRAAGLRGRGGAGFPAGIKWDGLRLEDGPRFVACNGAEGEPGTPAHRPLSEQRSALLEVAERVLLLGLAEMVRSLREDEGESAARAGTLATMVGGRSDVFERYLSILEEITSSVVRVGEVGAGGVAKLSTT